MRLVLSSCSERRRDFMHKTFAAVILSAALTFAQSQPTAAELLQKGIYAQETAGDLDGAIKIYHQIVDSHPTQREIAAQAQYRLGMTLLEKGDAAAASQEIQRLGWDFPDYRDLVAATKTGSGMTRVPITLTELVDIQNHQLFFSSLNEAEDLAKRAALDVAHDAEFDFTDIITLTGTVKQIQMMNPNAWLTVELAD